MQIADLLRLDEAAKASAAQAARTGDINEYKAITDRWTAIKNMEGKDADREIKKFSAEALADYYNNLGENMKSKEGLDKLKFKLDVIKESSMNLYRSALREGSNAAAYLHYQQANLAEEQLKAMQRIAAGEGTEADYAILNKKVDSGMTDAEQRARADDARQAEAFLVESPHDDRAISYVQQFNDYGKGSYGYVWDDSAALPALRKAVRVQLPAGKNLDQVRAIAASEGVTVSELLRAYYLSQKGK